jgi:hypothetical protein
VRLISPDRRTDDRAAGFQAIGHISPIEMELKAV